ALEPRRNVGAAAYALAEEAAAAGGDDRGARLFRVCAWNAFALQTIADTLLDADAAYDPATAGYVPRSTHSYVSECLDLVPTWIKLARVARADPSWRAPGLPEHLPRWMHDEPTMLGELHGIRLAYEALAPRVESDLVALEPSAPPQLGQLRRLHAEMTNAAELAEAGWSPQANAGTRGEIRWRLLEALGRAFMLGQLIAMPSLCELQREDDSWLQIFRGWPVLDRDGASVGPVHRVLGDRGTGVFEGIEIDTGIGSRPLVVAAHAVATIGLGQVKLSVTRAELAQ
ncbi:MAG TPA: hypothetical protein VKP14_05795, partial [Gaiellaceae bacterium]|nr:hypothetical protein [Gaiellaceae bacterium]